MVLMFMKIFINIPKIKFIVLVLVALKKQKTKNKGHRRQKGNYNRSVNYKHSDKIKIDKLNNQINELSLEEGKGDNDE